MLRSFDVGADPHALFLAQRISVLMLGFAVLVLLSLGLPPSKARSVVAAAVAVTASLKPREYVADR